MKMFITLLTVSFLLFSVIAQGLERRVDSVRSRNGRSVQRHRFYFNDAPRHRATRQPGRTYGTRRYEPPRYESGRRGGGGYGPNYYPNYSPDYPGLDFSRYNMMPYYNADRNWLRNYRLRHPDSDRR
jgi:hypothetical protein